MVQSGCALRMDGQHGTHSLRLGLAGGNEDDFFGPHDGADAHCHGVVRHSDVVKIDRVCVNCALGQMHFERIVGELVGRLVECNVTVSADAEELDIDTAHSVDSGGIAVALCFGVSGIAVEEVDVGRVNVNLGKQVLEHQGIVAVFVFLRQVAVFVEVERCDVFEADLAIFASLRHIVVGWYGCCAGGKTKHGFVVLLHDVDKHLACGRTDFFGGFQCDHFHN